MPWNIFHLTQKDTRYGLCTKLAPWTPTERGKVLKLVCRISKGMEFASCDPRLKGLFVLEGTGRKPWVWQNRTGWTDKPGTTYTLKDIPQTATRLELYRYNSHDKPWKELDIRGKSSVELTELPQQETLMFLARR